MSSLVGRVVGYRLAHERENLRVFRYLGERP